MPGTRCPLWTALALPLCALSAFAQAPATAPAPAAGDAPRVAATVNGQPILEDVVQRGLDTAPAAKRAEIRTERLNVLIDDLLIDQYLQQLMIAVDDKEVDKRVGEMREELKKRKQDFDKMLKDWKVSEAELRQHIVAELRWEKFVDGRATDQVLRQVFDSNKDVFDGSTVHARHILISPGKPAAPGAAAPTAEEAQAQLASAKKEIEDMVAQGMAKVAKDKPNLDDLAREKVRQNLLDDAFAAKAREKSMCPSKQNGGDVGWFQRAGFMVEPFAKAAFALKPYEMSDVVKTPFGYHLILAVERKPGREVKFEEAKDVVKEYYASTLREALAGQIRPKSKIEINPPPAAPAATPLPPPKP
jgi:peptidyl-prolyl cis-trans isomerase C